MLLARRPAVDPNAVAGTVVGERRHSGHDRTGSAPKTCLVTGATGYIGGRLVPELLAAGHRVRVMTRSPDRLRGPPVGGPGGDRAGRRRRTPTGWPPPAPGVDVVYYLVHALGGGTAFEETDRRTAEVMARAAREAGVGRLVYLGGLEPEGEDLSPHLRSRGEVAEILLGVRGARPRCCARRSCSARARPRSRCCAT